MSLQWKFKCDSMCAPSLSPVQLFVAPWTLALQAPMSVGFPWKECWTEMLFPTLGNLPDSGIETSCLVSPALTGKLYYWCHLGGLNCDSTLAKFMESWHKSGINNFGKSFC